MRGALPILAAALMGCGGGGSSAEPRSGLEVFRDSGCGGCHKLMAARSTGTVAGSLDGRNLAPADVERWVRDGGTGMPSFERRLSDAEIRALSEFVSASTRLR